MVRKPDLCISDATELLLTNGPAGPGDMAKPGYIVAGIDPATVDTYCTKFVNLTGKDVSMIKMAAEHGLGEIDLTTLQIKEV